MNNVMRKGWVPLLHLKESEESWNLKIKTFQTFPALKLHQNRKKKGTKRPRTTYVMRSFRFWNLMFFCFVFSFTSIWSIFLAARSKPHQYAISENAFSEAVIKREKKRLWQVYYFQSPEEIEPLLRSPLQKMDVSSQSETSMHPTVNVS